MWKAEDQSDLVWIDMQMGEDGIYRAAIDVAMFGYQQGEYRMHTYVSDAENNEYIVGEIIGTVY